MDYGTIFLLTWLAFNIWMLYELNSWIDRNFLINLPK